LQQGKKVFDGNVADVKAARGKVALKVNDFSAATRLLRERGLITDSAVDRFISLAEGRTTADIVQALVTAGLAVDGIWQHEQTVEDFYLNLIKPPSTDLKN